MKKLLILILLSACGNPVHEKIDQVVDKALSKNSYYECDFPLTSYPEYSIKLSRSINSKKSRFTTLEISYLDKNLILKNFATSSKLKLNVPLLGVWELALDDEKALATLNRTSESYLEKNKEKIIELVHKIKPKNYSEEEINTVKEKMVLKYLSQAIKLEDKAKELENEFSLAEDLEDVTLGTLWDELEKNKEDYVSSSKDFVKNYKDIITSSFLESSLDSIKEQAEEKVKIKIPTIPEEIPSPNIPTPKIDLSSLDQIYQKILNKIPNHREVDKIEKNCQTF